MKMYFENNWVKLLSSRCLYLLKVARYKIQLAAFFLNRVFSEQDLL